LIPGDMGEGALGDMRAAFLGGGESTKEEAKTNNTPYELTSAFQGEEGYDILCKACEDGLPFALAFVDMRMPPGWDGVQTIVKLWEKDPTLQVVICTAFSDYSWEQTVEILGESNRLLILKKPFDSIEISMLANALTSKWNMAAREKGLLDEALQSEQEARAYAASLETVNRALVTSRAGSGMELELRTELLVQISNEVQLRLAEVLENVSRFSEGHTGELPGELETVVDVSQHLMETLAEMMDVTALEQGQSLLDGVTCSPLKLAREVIENCRHLAREKGLELEVQVEGKIPEEFVSEPNRLRQILHNLVDNALRNTASGGVYMTLKNGRAEDWQRPRLVFEVQDSGRGIPPDRIGSIFEPCARGHAEGSGYGFGLALSRRMALILGGDITVRSEADGRSGTCFTFTLEYDHSGSGSEVA